MNRVTYKDNEYAVKFGRSSKRRTVCNIFGGPVGSRDAQKTLIASGSSARDSRDNSNMVVARTYALLDALATLPEDVALAVDSGVTIRRDLGPW